MKTLTFNSKSWHYWLATTIGDYSPNRTNKDFCAYTRSVIFGAGVVLILSAIALFLLYSTGREVYALYTCLFTKVCTFNKFEQMFATGVVIVAGVAGLMALFVWNENRKLAIRIAISNGTRPEPKPGFLKTAYKSLKEKTCFKVEFE